VVSVISNREYFQTGEDRTLKPEQKARQVIDSHLETAGWIILDYKELNLGAALGVAVREFPLGRDSADYLLFMERKAVGVVKAKPVGATLRGVAIQSKKYMDNIPDYVTCVRKLLPISYESTGAETLFPDIKEPELKLLGVLKYCKPETLIEIATENRCREWKVGFKTECGVL